jgi:hypothetical protein
LEHAAALSGIPRRVLNAWIEQGRAGQPDFQPFVDLIDQQLAELADELVSPIVEAARGGNLKASMWIYDHRIKPYEDRALKKQFEAEDRFEEREREVVAEVSSAEADELAARVMAQLTASQDSQEKH